MNTDKSCSLCICVHPWSKKSLPPLNARPTPNDGAEPPPPVTQREQAKWTTSNPTLWPKPKAGGGWLQRSGSASQWSSRKIISGQLGQARRERRRCQGPLLPAWRPSRPLREERNFSRKGRQGRKGRTTPENLTVDCVRSCRRRPSSPTAEL